MDPSPLEIFRDLAIALLVLEISVFVLAIGAALYFAVRGVRFVKRWVRLPLLHAQLWALRMQHGVVRASSAIVQVPIAAESAGTRLRATIRAFGDLLMGS